MENKKDIGTALEKKLQGAHKSPSPDMWGKINDSLDKKDRRRKRAFWIWGTGILLIGLVSLYFGTQQNEPENDIILTSKINNIDPISDAINTTSEMDNTQETTIEKLEQKNSNAEIVETTQNKTNGKLEVEKENAIKISEENSVHISQEKATTSNQTLKASKEKVIDEGYEVTKNYRYYNSKTKEEIITENKIMMDSVIEKNIQLQKSLDSITELKSEMEKENDSI